MDQISQNVNQIEKNLDNAQEQYAQALIALVTRVDTDNALMGSGVSIIDGLTSICGSSAYMSFRPSDSEKAGLEVRVVIRWDSARVRLDGDDGFNDVVYRYTPVVELSWPRNTNEIAFVERSCAFVLKVTEVVRALMTQDSMKSFDVIVETREDRIAAREHRAAEKVFGVNRQALVERHANKCPKGMSLGGIAVESHDSPECGFSHRVKNRVFAVTVKEGFMTMTRTK